jgi:hypothetical protein
MNRRRASVVVSSLLAVGLLAGCGGGGSTAATDKLTPVAAVQRAAEKASAESAKYTMEMTGPGINVRGTGAYRGGSDPVATMAFDNVSAMGMSFGKGVEYRMVGKAMYVKLGADWIEVPVDAKGAKVDLGPMDSSAFTDPVGALKKMLDTSDVTEVGTETIDGARTTHYRARTEMDGAFGKQDRKGSNSELGAELEKALQKQLGAILGGGTASADVWIDDAYRARRFVLDIPMLGGMKLTVNISDYGKPVNVEAPADAKSFDDKNLSLDGLLGEDFGKNLFGGDMGKMFGGDLGKLFGGDMNKMLGDDFDKLFQDLSNGAGSQKA